MRGLSINGATYIYIKLFRLNRVTVTLEFKFDAQPQDICRYTVLPRYFRLKIQYCPDLWLVWPRRGLFIDIHTVYDLI